MLNASNRGHRRLQPQIAVTIGLIVALLGVFVIALTIVLADRQNGDVADRERQLAHGMINSRAEYLRKIADDYAHWDEALQNLVLVRDPDWADRNIGSNLADTFGIDLAFVVSPDETTTYSMIDGERASRAIKEVVSADFPAFLRAQQLTQPDAVISTTVIVNGQPALAAIAALRPFDNKVDSTKGARHLLVFVDPLDDTLLASLSRSYQLPNLRVVAADDAMEASISWQSFDGRPIRLGWDASNPGGQMIKDLLPALIVLLIAFATVTGFLLRYALIAARELEISERRASYDALTGLLNRSALFWRLETATLTDPAANVFALLYCDLDGFKLVNDTYGHDIGDSILRETAQRIERAVPDEASVYRLGGDEFAIVLPDYANVAAVRIVALQIIEAVKIPVVIGKVTAHVGATIGVALAPTDATSTAELLRIADQALYVGKSAGRGVVNFHLEEIEQELA